MKRLFKPRLRRRVLATSVAIIALITSALAGVINQLYSQNYMTAYSSQLVAQMPMVMAQLKHSGMIVDVDSMLDRLDPSDTDYKSVLCDLSNHTVWLSDEAKAAQLHNVCQQLPNPISVPTIITLDNQQSYIAYGLGTKTPADQNAYQLVVLRSAEQYITSLNRLQHRTSLYLALCVFIAVAALITAFHWSFQPLRKLACQLYEVEEAKRKTLDNDYPMELHDITSALNRLIQLGYDQQGRYRHAMDDLAHSLKTRLAATHALLDDKALVRDDLNQRVMEQICQMDSLVQYQLKRAMMGQQGLQKENSPLLPALHSFERLLNKVYSEKPVHLGLHVPPALTVPINKDDLMELLGNILENAYRFCIGRVDVFASDSNLQTIIRIEDDGPGVPIALREDIFQRGMRADQRNPGQGIGLSVCHDIVMSYRGSIHVESASIEGAAFVITLPHYE